MQAGAAGLMQYSAILREMRALLCVDGERLGGRSGAHVWCATDLRVTPASMESCQSPSPWCDVVTAAPKSPSQGK